MVAHKTGFGIRTEIEDGNIMRVAVNVLPSPSELGEALAHHVADRLTARTSDRFLIGWPAGRTPEVLVEALCALARDGLDLSAVVFVGMDEFLTGEPGHWRNVDTNVHYSCRGWTQHRVIEPLRAAASPGRGPSGDAVWTPSPLDPEAYERRISDSGGVDFFVVASGSGDGHVALNSPPADRNSRTRIVELPDSTRRDNLATFPQLKSLDQAPTHGVTVGLATISDAHEIALLLPGDGKREAARRLLELDAFDPTWPASFVHNHPRATCWVDEHALGRSRSSFTAVPAAGQASAAILKEKS